MSEWVPYSLLSEIRNYSHRLNEAFEMTRHGKRQRPRIVSLLGIMYLMPLLMSLFILWSGGLRNLNFGGCLLFFFSCLSAWHAYGLLSGSKLAYGLLLRWPLFPLREALEADEVRAYFGDEDDPSNNSEEALRRRYRQAQARRDHNEFLGMSTHKFLILVGLGIALFAISTIALIGYEYSDYAPRMIIREKHPTKQYEFWVNTSKPLFGQRNYGYTLSVDGVRPTQYCGQPYFTHAETLPIRAEWLEGGSAILINYEDGNTAVLRFDANLMEKAEKSNDYHYYVNPQFTKE